VKEIVYQAVPYIGIAKVFDFIHATNGVLTDAGCQPYLYRGNPRRRPKPAPKRTNVIVVIGAGLIGQAIARRVSAGKHVVLADLRQENADAAAKTLSDAGFDVSTTKVDVSSRASVQALVEQATSLAKFPVSSMPPAFPLPKRRRKRS
jgi:threonine dehydrogenase-like Zn-dependent dehydrogenase